MFSLPLRLSSWRVRFCQSCIASEWKTESGCWFEPAASPSRILTPMRSSTSSAPTLMSSRFLKLGFILILILAFIVLRRMLPPSAGWMSLIHFINTYLTWKQMWRFVACITWRVISRVVFNLLLTFFCYNKCVNRILT